MNGRFWSLLFQLPQTYFLVVGTLLGYGVWIFLLGQRPFVMAVGGAIAILTLVAWGWQVATSPELQLQLRPETSQNLLEAAVFTPQLDRICTQYREIAASPSQSNRRLWREAVDWSRSCQTFAASIAERRSELLGEALETLHTVLALLEQVGQAIQVTEQVETASYRQVAQQRLSASRDRLQTTYQQLQLLRDQLAVSSLEAEGETGELPVNLQLLIQANAAAIQESTNSSPL